MQLLSAFHIGCKVFHCLLQRRYTMRVRSKVLLLAFIFALLVTAVSLAGATDVTLIVSSDTHFTGKTVPAPLKPAIQAMNAHLVGLAYPSGVGGTVATPVAALVAGDLCDGGAGIGAPDTKKWYTSRNYADQWYGFNYYFPRDGVNGDVNRLRFPTLATAGNHDFYNNFGTAASSKTWYVANQLVSRYGLSSNITNGNVYYSTNIDGLHVVSLGRWGDSYVLNWLAADLQAIGTDQPVVLFLHYAFDDGQTWYTDAERQQLANVIAGYNVIAILHGHTHGTGHYQWQGYDCYDDGTAGYNSEFGVLHVTDTALSYCQYKAAKDSRGNWKSGAWTWWHSKSLQ
jgi:hypothetical protein